MKQETLEYYRKYYQQNKDKYNKANHKVQCNVCGGVFAYRTRSQHVKTNKHQQKKDTFLPRGDVPIINLINYAPS